MEQRSPSHELVERLTLRDKWERRLAHFVTALIFVTCVITILIELGVRDLVTSEHRSQQTANALIVKIERQIETGTASRVISQVLQNRKIDKATLQAVCDIARNDGVVPLPGACTGIQIP